ncbi:hypothetical protein ACP3TH_00535 [Desulforudis sp. 1031]|uniref:hypothetical protein n=1 Tax=unclassified Candidatus Desulforudis TaxID=2635950 RepID=UPI003CE44F06
MGPAEYSDLYEALKVVEATGGVQVGRQAEVDAQSNKKGPYKVPVVINQDFVGNQKIMNENAGTDAKSADDCKKRAPSRRGLLQ